MAHGKNGRTVAQAKRAAMAGDDVDLARIRMAWTAVAVVVGAGLGSVLGIALLDECCDEFGDIVYLPIVAAWSVALGVAAGRWAYKRSLGTGVALSLLLAWLSAHFLLPGLLRTYTPLEWILDVGGGPVGVLLFWALLGMAMVVAGLGIERLAQRIP